MTLVKVLCLIMIACWVISATLDFGVKISDRLILKGLRKQNKDLTEFKDLACANFEVKEEDVFYYPGLLNGIENNDLYEIHYDENRRVYQIRIRNKIGGMDN